MDMALVFLRIARILRTNSVDGLGLERPYDDSHSDNEHPELK